MNRIILKLLPLALLFASVHLPANELAGAYRAMRLGNFSAAAAVFEREAASGSSEAQYQLGKLYLVGRGVDKNKDLAREWLDKAASSGDGQAQYTLGLMLLKSGDAAQGREWLQRAAEQDHVRAKSELEQLLAGSETRVQLINPEKLQAQWFDAAARGDAKRIERLLQGGADIGIKDDYQRNALYYLVACDNEQGVELLLQHGIDVNVTDRFGETAVMLAVKQGSEAVVRLVVSGGADTSVTTAAGDSLIHLAIVSGNMDALQVLLEAGAPRDQTNKAGQSPLDLAARVRNTKAEKLLRSSGGESWG